MDADIIEFRIQELEHERLRLAKEMDILEDRRKEIQGGITELWKWHETVKDAQGYGRTTFDGKAQVMKLPVLGSKELIKDAIENRGTAIDGEDKEKAEDVRMDRAQHDSKRLIRLMDKQSPFIEDNNDGTGTDSGSD